jgi:arginine repressor
MLKKLDALLPSDITISKSTLDRDIKELGYEKKGNEWVLRNAESEQYKKRIKRLKSLIADQTKSMTAPVQLLAIKTNAGTGRAVASAIEGLFMKKIGSFKRVTNNRIIGTISDESTVLVVIPDNDKALATIKEIRKLAPSARANINLTTPNEDIEK